MGGSGVLSGHLPKLPDSLGQKVADGRDRMSGREGERMRILPKEPRSARPSGGRAIKRVSISFR